MKNTGPNALVLAGYGINCDYETAEACNFAGFSARRVHINDVLESGRKLLSSKLIVFPGGFSFGDDLGSGVAFSSKVRFSLLKDGNQLYDLLMEYVRNGGLVLGICNGFQILVRLGMIPAVDTTYGRQLVTLAPNREGYFIDKWVKLRVDESSPSVFTAGIRTMDLPVRHGEGRFVTGNKETLNSLIRQRLVSLRYCDESGEPALEFPQNPNGSEDSVAGICDPTGRIFGMMPDPEAAVSFYQYPDWTKRKEIAARRGTRHPEEGDGYLVFQNAFKYVE